MVRACATQKRYSQRPRSDLTTQKRPVPHSDRLTLDSRAGLALRREGGLHARRYEVCIAYSKRRVWGPVLRRGPGGCRWGAW